MKIPDVWKWKFYALTLTLACAGIVFLFLGEVLRHRDPNNAWGALLGHIGVAMLVGGTVAMLEKVFIHRDLLRELERKLNLQISVVESGLGCICPNAAGETQRYERLIRESRELSIVVNYGGSWVSPQKSGLSQRFHTPGRVTELFQIDPEGAFLQILEAKQGDQGKLKQKILQTRQTIIDLYERGGRNGTLRIYSLRFFPTMAIFLGSEEALVTLHTISGQQEVPVPLFVCENNGDGNVLYRFLLEEVQRLRAQGVPVYDSDRPRDPAGAPPGPALPPAGPGNAAAQR